MCVGSAQWVCHVKPVSQTRTCALPRSCILQTARSTCLQPPRPSCASARGRRRQRHTWVVGQVPLCPGSCRCHLPRRLKHTRRAVPRAVRSPQAGGRACRATPPQRAAECVGPWPGALVAVLSALSHHRVGGILFGNDTRPAPARCTATLALMGCALPLPQNALHRGAAARHAAACGPPPCRDAGDVRPSGCGCSRALCCSCLSTCGLRCCAARHKPVPGARCSFLAHGATWWRVSAAR